MDNKLKLIMEELEEASKIFDENALSKSSTSSSSFSSSTVKDKNAPKNDLNCNLNISNGVNSDVNDNLNGIPSQEVLVEGNKIKEAKFNFEKKETNCYSQKKKKEWYLENNFYTYDVSDSSDDEQNVKIHVNEKDKVENVSGTTENEATVLDNANDQHMEDISEKREKNNQNIDGGTLTAKGLRDIAAIISKKKENTQTVKVGDSVCVQPKQRKPIFFVAANISKPKSLNNSVIDLTGDDENTISNINIRSNTINPSGPGSVHLPALVTIPNEKIPNKQQYNAHLANIVNRLTKKVVITQNKKADTITHVTVPNPGQFIKKLQKLPTSGSINLNNSKPIRKLATFVGQRVAPTLPKSKFISTPAWKKSPSSPILSVKEKNSKLEVLIEMQCMDDSYAKIKKYRIYTYEDPSSLPNQENWNHFEDIESASLSITLTIKIYGEGVRYYFAVQAVDIHGRGGPFSAPKTWD